MHLEDKLQIRPNKIFLCGDSAGGNLAMALACRAAQEGLQMPAGIFLTYPALNLEKE